MGFLAIVGTGVAERFPRLRFAFAEAGVEWLPWLVHVMDSYWRMGHGIFKDDPGFGHSKIKPSEILRDGKIYLVCEEDEDLSETLKLIGPERIMLGSDMPHSESHPNSFQKFEQRTDLDDKVKAQILGANARRFFAR
jgi:predicted TIM-barrel fold metal-dependent hydrolase